MLCSAYAAIAECQGDAVPIPTLIQAVNKINAAQYHSPAPNVPRECVVI